MNLGHIDEGDRKTLFVIGCCALAVTIGLTATGIWQFLYHEPNTAWSGYVVGLGNTPGSPESTGVAELHGLFGDLAGILTLFAGAWFSVRVIYRLSWFSVVTLAVVIGALITGGIIRFNASVHGGVVDVATAGYTQFFSGGAEMAITDRFELGRLWMVIWTFLHVASIPFLFGSAWFTLNQSRRRHTEMKARGPSWIEGLESKRDGSPAY